MTTRSQAEPDLGELEPEPCGDCGGFGVVGGLVGPERADNGYHEEMCEACDGTGEERRH